MSVSPQLPTTAPVRRVPGLIVWILVCFGAASFGALFQPGQWYAGLNKPAWTPPNWLFAPVWSALYLMMAVAAWLVWLKGGFLGQKQPLALFVAQLLCNALWSWLCFGLHNLSLALLDILGLWLLLVLTVLSFAPVSRPATVLLLPYLGWVSFAAALNFTLWLLNR